MTSRREFLRAGALVAATASSGWAASSNGIADLAGGMSLDMPIATPVGVHPKPGDPLLRELALRALDAARSAGATYADVRITVDRRQSFYFGNPPVDAELIAIGVRALANGAWGFVASNIWTLDEAARLGSTAARQARGNAWPGEPPATWEALPVAATGSWVMPVKRDPFSVSVAEKLDYLRSLDSHVRRFRNALPQAVIIFTKQEKTFASSEGAFTTQATFTTAARDSRYTISVNDPLRGRSASRSIPLITPTGTGYELFDDIQAIDQIAVCYEEARRNLLAEPATSARGDIVFDGAAMSGLVSASLGAPLELDRALGLEANAGGTSYLAPAERVLGKPVGASLLTVTGERNAPGGVASVQWDDDGVSPDEFTLIRDGVVVDYQTSREHVSSLASWYAERGQPLRSHGCASADDAGAFPLIRSANLHMQPSGNASFDELVSQVDDGFAVIGGSVSMDHQRLTGQGRGEMVFRIRKGKITTPVSGAAYLFRSPELWKGLAAVGGTSTVARRGFRSSKGQPNQYHYYSVSAPAAVVRNIAMVNLRAGSGA